MVGILDGEALSAFFQNEFAALGLESFSCDLVLLYLSGQLLNQKSEFCFFFEIWDNVKEIFFEGEGKESQRILIVDRISHFLILYFYFSLMSILKTKTIKQI